MTKRMAIEDLLEAQFGKYVVNLWLVPYSDIVNVRVHKGVELSITPCFLNDSYLPQPFEDSRRFLFRENGWNHSPAMLIEVSLCIGILADFGLACGAIHFEEMIA